METSMQVQGSSSGHLGERLFALIDHDLSPQDEASALHHLDECEDCAAEHRKIAGAVGALGGLGKARAPTGFAARVMRRVRAERRGGHHILVDHKVPYEGVIILILAAAATAAIFAFMTQGGWDAVAHLGSAGPR